MSVTAFIRRCLAVGMPLETALLAAEQMEAARVAPAPAPHRPNGYGEMRREAMRAAGLTAAGWKALRLQILERDSYECVYCADDATCVDHYIPITRGGPFHEDNLVAACTSCNCAKKGMSGDQFTEMRMARAAR